MGNCLNCFKESQATTLETNPQRKEEMPEDILFPAPSHMLPTSAQSDNAILINGNHPTSAPLETTTVSLLYSSQKRTHSKSAPIMGAMESKPSVSKINAMFETYKDETDDAILAEGIEQFCKDLQLSPDEFRVLVLAWKLSAQQMCCFTRSEFVNGLKSMRVDSIKGIQSRLPEVVCELEQNAELFKDLYRFTFRFGLDSAAGQRILPVDMAMVLWRLVFTIREPPVLSRWLSFLESHPMIRGIPRDTWNMFLNFAEAVGDDLSSYDDNEAWPSLFDDFVEYENDQANQNISKDKEMDGLFIKQDD